MSLLEVLDESSYFTPDAELAQRHNQARVLRSVNHPKVALEIRPERRVVVKPPECRRREDQVIEASLHQTFEMCDCPTAVCRVVSRIDPLMLWEMSGRS